jgi:hypothetical protein
MPRKSKPETERHTYSVFVNTVLEDGRLSTEMIYFGNSEYTAKMTLAQAIMHHSDAHSIDVRRDFRLLVRAKLEHPNLP